MALDYLENIGVQADPEEDNTEVESNSEEESNEDLSLDSEDATSENVDEGKVQTEELAPSELASLKEQIAGMEKRIADKDDFINELREQVKAKEEAKVEENTPEEEEDDFWDNPEEKYKNLQKQLKVQQLQIQEGYYAQTVDGYFKTVNPDALKEAVSTDSEFAKEFNSSSEPYRVAYEYLSKKTEAKTTEQAKLREEIKQELLKEMNVKGKKEIPPNINNSGSSNSSTESDDGMTGFASFFGSK